MLIASAMLAISVFALPSHGATRRHPVAPNDAEFTNRTLLIVTFSEGTNGGSNIVCSCFHDVADPIRGIWR